jgi:hypothetical protein
VREIAAEVGQPAIEVLPLDPFLGLSSRIRAGRLRWHHSHDEWGLLGT